MGKLFSSVSSLWVLFIPLLSVSKVGVVDMIDDCHEEPNDSGLNVLMLIRQLGELRESGLITEKEFESKKKKLLDYI